MKARWVSCSSGDMVAAIYMDRPWDICGYSERGKDCGWEERTISDFDITCLKLEPSLVTLSSSSSNLRGNEVTFFSTHYLVDTQLLPYRS